MSSLVGGSARYFCDNGFSLVGDSRRVCRPDETWSGDVPTCERKYDTTKCSVHDCIVDSVYLEFW